MSTEQSGKPSPLAAFALRYVDGASRPVLVEQLYVNWDLNTHYTLSFQGTRDRVAGWWPTQGVAWEKFGDAITELVASGDLVMCKNTDPEDHPEHHITQDVGDPFPWGKPPLVLRYLTTPAGSIAWRKVLDDRAAAARASVANHAAEREQQRARAEIRADRVHAAAAAGADTLRALATATGYPRADVRTTIHELVAAGRLVFAGGGRWSGYRWRVAGEQAAPADGAPAA